VAATGERTNERGEHPNGYLGYAADARMFAIITWENRIKPREVVPTDEERIKLFGTMISYGRHLHIRRRESHSSRRYFLESKLERHRPGAFQQARRQHAHHHHPAEQKLRRRPRGPQHP